MSDFFPFNTINEKLHSDLSHLEPKLLFSVAFIGRGFSISVWMNRRFFLPVIRVKRCSRTVYSPYSRVYDFPIRDRKVVLHIRHCFPKASRVIDRFYVQRLTFDALQEMRISHRWDAINEETDARLSLAKWYDKVADSEFKSCNTIAATVYEHHDAILNFFINRSTNASAESFNAKIKAFRASLRAVVDTKFFIFRLPNIYA